MKVIIGEERLVYSAPVNEVTNKWGLYAIPRMWRDVSGKIIIRVNGEIDMGDTDNMQGAPNLFFVSEDNGKTWEMSSYVPAGIGEDLVPLIQPTLWQDDKGDVHMLLRSAKEKVFRSDSVDGGKTWCKAYDTGLLNPNSGIDLVRDKDEIYLVYNPTAKNWGDRTPLLLAVSKDNGDTWENILTFELRVNVSCAAQLLHSCCIQLLTLS